MKRVENVEQLAELSVGAVLVDTIGLAYQVIQLGADWSAHKGERDTRRPGFVQAGNHVTYEVRQMVSVLPMRVVDDGHAEPPVRDRCPDDGKCHLSECACSHCESEACS